MPGKDHLPKRSAKENRMYEHIKEGEEKRHPGRAEEIAARTVNKHHTQSGHRGGE